MQKFSNYIALLLLVLFVRAMVPDALLLELHAHTHTIHTDQTDNHKAQVGKKHKHCPVEDLFGAPFQKAVNPVALVPVSHTCTYAAFYTGNWHGASVHFASLRGPPVV